MNEVSPIALFKSVVAEKRWTQHSWHRHEAGKDYLCLAAAWGKPGEINEPSQCPTNLFPQWLFELMPALDDGVCEADVPWLFQSFADRAEAMATLSPEAWQRIQTGFMIGMVRQSVEAAKPVQTDPMAEHWQQVLAAADQVAAALLSGDPEELKAAEAAARAAAWAAEAAEAAAWAAEAAEAAARAAEAAAYRQTAELLFKIIDAELAATV